MISGYRVYIAFAQIFICVIFISCAPEISKIQRYKESLESKEISNPTYDEVISILGEPEIYKEHESDITASWSRSYWEKVTIASDLKGEKLIINFDKVTKRMLTWDYKTW